MDILIILVHYLTTMLFYCIKTKEQHDSTDNFTHGVLLYYNIIVKEKGVKGNIVSFRHSQAPFKIHASIRLISITYPKSRLLAKHSTVWMRAMVTESEKDLKLLNKSEWAIIVFYASVRECEKKRHENSRDSVESTLVAHNKWSEMTRRGIKNSIHIRAHSHSLPAWVCVCRACLFPKQTGCLYSGLCVEVTVFPSSAWEASPFNQSQACSL